MKKSIILVSILLGLSSAALAQTPQWIWARGGDFQNTQARAESVASDSRGNAAICGVYYASLSLNNVVLETLPGYTANFFIALYDQNGSLQWARRIGSVLQAHGAIAKVSIDSQLNVYVFGYYQDSAEFNDTAMFTTNFTSVFAAKYDKQGNRVWIKTLVSNVQPFDNNHQSTYQFGSCAESQLFIVGSFQNSADFGGKVLQTATEGMYYASYGSDGSLLSAVILSDVGSCSSLSLGFDHETRFIYLCGQLSPSGNLFVDKLALDGTRQWQAKTSGGYALAEGIAATEHSVYLTGSFGDSISAGNRALKNHSSFFDGFLLKLSSEGQVSWLKQIGGERVDQSHAVSVDNDDNAYIAGYYQLEAAIGTFLLTDPYYLDNIGFLAKYDSSGKVLFAERIQQSDGGISEATSICAWKTSDKSLVHLVGGFGKDAIFGGTTIGGGSNGGGFFLAAMDQNKINSSVAPAIPSTALSSYPNPARSSVTLRFQLNSSSNVEIEFIDILGRTMYHSTNVMASGQQSVRCNITTLPKGIYDCLAISNGISIGKTSVVIE